MSPSESSSRQRAHHDRASEHLARAQTLFLELVRGMGSEDTWKAYELALDIRRRITQATGMLDRHRTAPETVSESSGSQLSELVARIILDLGTLRSLVDFSLEDFQADCDAKRIPMTG